MNEVIMVIVLCVYSVGAYFVSGLFIADGDICILPTREKSPIEKWVIKRKIGGKRK